MDKFKKFKRYSRSLYDRFTSGEDPKKDDIKFVTHITTENRSITWTIENINTCPVKPGEYLESSSTFSTGITNITQWCLRLYPKGRNLLDLNKVGFFLHKITPSTNISVRVQIYERNILHHEEEKVVNEPEEIGTDAFMDWDQFKGLINLVVVCKTHFAYIDEAEVSSGIREPHSINCNCTLSSDFKELYGSEKFTDAVLQVGKRQFNVHKAILAARSMVFSAMFEHDMKESKTNIVTIEDVEPCIMGNILQYIYTSKIDNFTVDKAILIYPVSDKYSLVQLKNECFRVILKNLSVENVCRVAVLADLHSDSKLKDATNYHFRNYSAEIFEKGEWKALVQDKPLLASEIVKSVVSNYKTNCASK